MAKFHSFLWLSSIPLYILYIYIYYTFFIHSSVVGHLGYFDVSAVVNNASMNIRVYVSFQIIAFCFFSDRLSFVGFVCLFVCFSNCSESQRRREMLFIRSPLKRLTHTSKGGKSVSDLLKDSITLAKSTQTWWAVFRTLHSLRVASEVEGEDTFGCAHLRGVWLAGDCLWINPQWTYMKICYALCIRNCTFNTPRQHVMRKQQN